MNSILKCKDCGAAIENPVLNAYESDKKFCPKCGSEL